MRRYLVNRPATPRRHGGRSLRSRAALVVLTGVATSASIGGAIVATAAVPSFPDNIVAFPDRDFVTVEGYQNHIGETATVEVTRNGSVVGSAQAVVAQGDVAFEVNHPGGVCWGAGTNLKVTPDIKAGDQLTVKFGGAAAGDTTVQDAAVDADSTLNGSTLTVTGHIASGVNPGQVEQRIVNSDLTPTAVGRRDVRAVPGPMTRAPKGGYSSSLDISGTSFTATYEFDTPEIARIAASGGGERFMAWELEDAAANRQGLSIAEYGELGGPGMGGCPAGPGDQAAPQPGTATTVRSTDKTQLQVNWSAATPAPGAAAVTGYSVEAIAKTASATGEQTQVGRRTSADAARATIAGLDPAETYTVEVRSLAGPRMSEAFTVQTAAPSAGQPPEDQTKPVVTSTPVAQSTGAAEATSVTLSSEQTADIYFTTDGSPALSNGDLPSDAAKLYTTAIPISAETTLHWVAFDRAGNFDVGQGTFAPPAAAPAPQAPPAPNAPTLGASTGGQGSVTLKWDSSDSTITGYGVQLYNNANGAPVGDLRPTPDKTLTIGDVAPGSYSFTVKAQNAGGWGAESAKSGALMVTAAPDRVTIASARWKVGDFRIRGNTSSTTGTITIRTGGPTGPSIGTATMTPAVAPATGRDFELRLRAGAATTQAGRPAQIWATSSQGGVAGPFTVVNG